MSNGAHPPFRYTHDLGQADGYPRKANIDDLGGDEHQSDDSAPQIGIDYSASENNEQNRHIAAHERVVPLARLWVEFSGGSPVIVAVDSLAPQGDGLVVNVSTSSFTVAHPSTGVVEITWATSLLAPQTRRPSGCPHSKVGIYFDKKASPPANTDGVVITMWDPATPASGKDGDFMVEINGA